MAQHDYDIANQSGSAFRSDLNSALQAIVSQNSGSSAPATTYAYQFWADTSTGLLKIRNGSNNAFITVGTLASVNLGLLSLAGGTMTAPLILANGTAALPSLTTVGGGTDTGFYSTGNADEIAAATSGLARWLLNATGYMTGAVNGLGSGLYQAQQIYRRNTTLAGSDVSTVQSLLGVGVTLIASTVYEFEIVFALAKTAGSTSHTFALGFGGTATLNNIAYQLDYRSLDSGTLPPSPVGASFTMFLQSASSTVVSSALTSANATHHGIIKGTVNINAAGTFIPQYTLSAAPGGAYTTQIGSYMKIAPVGAAGVISQGNWA
jgi:hypothetical protein